MKKLLVAFLVTWDVSGFSLFQCNDQKQVDPAIGLCVQPVNMARSAQFDKKDEADKLVGQLKKIETPAYKINNIKEFTEMGK